MSFNSFISTVSSFISSFLLSLSNEKSNEKEIKALSQAAKSRYDKAEKEFSKEISKLNKIKAETSVNKLGAKLKQAIAKDLEAAEKEQKIEEIKESIEAITDYRKESQKAYDQAIAKEIRKYKKGKEIGNLDALDNQLEKDFQKFDFDDEVETEVEVLNDDDDDNLWSRYAQ